MQIFLLATGVVVLYLIAYHTYGKWLGKTIFSLTEDRLCPSEELRDDKDYVPTSKAVVFGHHFTSIAGTGPIVGPTIGVIWGWLPALLWVVFGSILIGAVHDFGSLVVSLRNQGKSVGEIAGMIVGPRVRAIFLWILLMALTLVLAVFGLVIAAVFKTFPMAIFPCLVQIPLAVAVGHFFHRRGSSIIGASILTLALMYAAVIFGNAAWLESFNSTLMALPIWVWTSLLLAYCYAASVMPVWLLLQPRDFINALQLLSILGLLVVGLIVAGTLGRTPDSSGMRPPLEFVAPMVQWKPEGAPMVFPFLFITIACGAVSGFHCLVSSGTSSKQLKSETDARFIGYGSMLTEGFLVTLVIFACAAGLGLGITLDDGSVLSGTSAWAHRYANWGQAGSLPSKIAAFVSGAENFLAAIGISKSIATALMGVFVASFAATTMDTACRLQRYVVQEIFSGIQRKRPSPAIAWLSHPHGATLLAVAGAAILAAIPTPGTSWSLEIAGKGGAALWPIFGATNQLIAGIAFIVITFFVRASGKPVWFLIPPTLMMIAMPMVAMCIQLFTGTANQPSWIEAKNYPLIGMGLPTVILSVWLTLEAILIWKQDRENTL